MKFDLVISDYDGTLGIGNKVNPQTVEAINQYVKKGGKFVLCTGRMFKAIEGICKQYGLNGIVASFQGALINDINTGEIIRDGGIDYEFAAQAIVDLKSENAPVVADIDDYMYCEKPSNYTEFHKEFTRVIQVENLEKFVLEQKKPVYKIISTADAEFISYLTQKYGEKYKGKALCNNGSDTIMEIVNPEYSKGTAVRFLAKHFGIPLNKVMTIGDSTNDFELMGDEWHGVAVGDAKEQLKKLAKEVTVPYAEQPVKTLLEKYCL